MVKLTTRERVDAFWSSTLDITVAELHTPGVHVRQNPPERASWRGVYVLALGEAVSVFAPTDLIEQLSVALADHHVASVMEPKTWHGMLAGAAKVVFGPVIHHYRDTAEGLAALAKGRRINPQDAAALARLRAAIAPDEWLSAGFSAQPAMLFAIFEEDRMVAAANLTEGPDAATDVGIVVHPEARGRGHAVAVAALAAHQALLMHGVARFRTLATSEATLAIARKLGFVEYGRNLAVYLSAEV